jgi:hypothetical protein
MPVMKEYLIRRSTAEATGREKSWDNTTYDTIDCLTGDASRFQSTPMTYSPPNDAFRLSTIVSMDDALPATS